ncbi:MAG: nitronate monooxygenase [Pseudomonadota bacterium]
MPTRVTDLFDLRYPVLLSGMSWVSTPELVAAVSAAGGLGILATGTLGPDEVRAGVRRIRELTDAPFGANVTLYFPGAERNAAILVEERVPVVNYAMGKGARIAEAVHAYGGKVIATVTSAKHALAAQRDGADALIVTGHEAAGHGGKVTSLVLVPSIVDVVELPVIAAGGFADHRGYLAARALGAEGIAMGTRFMASVESPVPEVLKQRAVEAGVDDTLYSPKVDGIAARVFASRGARRLVGQPLNPVAALLKSRRIAGMMGFSWPKLALGIVASGPENALRMSRMALGFTAFEAGMLKGDLERGVLPLGQVAGLIHELLPVAEILSRVVDGE